MLYAAIRSLVAFALRLFYRVEVVSSVGDLSGPVMFVGNHPNSLIDPALVFIVTHRQVTFLAREPLFRVPVLGLVLRAIGALPVYRRQDHPGLMEKNEGTLQTAARALSDGRAITIFPEGQSHSAPQLADLKTGCARIALRAAKAGTALRIIPVGLTYEQKHRFRSRVHLEVGEPILVAATQPLDADAEAEWVRELTERVSVALRQVTLNLETWEDLELIETADRLLALRDGALAHQPERLRMLARGVALLRNEDAERFAELKDELLSFRARLTMVRARLGDLEVGGRRGEVWLFALTRLATLLVGFPLFAVGVALFSLPFLLLRALSLALPVSRDRVGTLKFVAALIVVPAWWAALTVAGWALAGVQGLLVTLLAALPLALFTRSFFERWAGARDDLRTLFRMGNRAQLRQHVLYEGERLQNELHALADRLRVRL